MFDEKFWIAVSFLLFVTLLYKKLSNITTTALNKKSSEIEEQLKKASLLKLEAQEIRDNYLKQKKENMINAQKILDNAEKQAKQLIADGNEELEKLIEQKFTQAEKLLKEQEVIAINNIRVKAIEHSVERFKEFITKSSHRQKLHNSSIDLLKKAI